MCFIADTLFTVVLIGRIKISSGSPHLSMCTASNADPHLQFREVHGVPLSFLGSSIELDEIAAETARTAAQRSR